jgi:2-methylisocitrate lyase-like PEP mutase family enzyme
MGVKVVWHMGGNYMRGSERLRDRLSKPGLIVAPGTYDAKTAMAVERAGFEALLLGGAAFAAAGLGLPDYGLITMTELIDACRRSAAAVDVPIILDLDDAGGTPHQVYRFVREAEAAGAAALLLEDLMSNRKHFWTGEGSTGYSVGELRPKAEMMPLVRAAVDARRDPNTVIVARTDAGVLSSIEDAIDRLGSYAEMGADMLFPSEIPFDAVSKFTQALQYPVLVGNDRRLFGDRNEASLTFNDREQLELAGVRLVFVPAVCRGALRGFNAALDDLRAGRPFFGGQPVMELTAIEMETINASAWAERASN